MLPPPIVRLPLFPKAPILMMSAWIAAVATVIPPSPPVMVE